MANKKWTTRRLSVGFSKEESEILETYCEMTGRTYTDVIRECVRKLKPSIVQENLSKS
jgi:predicted DNA-binding protein